MAEVMVQHGVDQSCWTWCSIGTTQQWNMMMNKVMGILVMGSMMLYEIMYNMMYGQHYV